MRDTLAAWYLSSLPAHADSLEEALARLRSEGDDAPLRRIAHRLHGSGGSYGFPTVSEAASMVERAGTDELADAAGQLVALLRSLGAEPKGATATILVIDDDPAIHALARRQLERPSRPVVSATTADEAQALLRDHDVGLVLLDICLDDSDGRDLLADLRAARATADLPVAVLSVRSDEATRSECYALGADAYFVKPLAQDTLVAAAESLIGRRIQARAFARTDPLTGLRNRRGLEDEYHRLQAWCQRTGSSLCLAVLDFDRFKAINDTWGHPAGDEVLTAGTRAIRSRLRRTDLMGRWGGEEFLVLLPDTDVDGAIQALTGALETLKATELEVGGARIQGISFSGGVTDATGLTDLLDAVSRADAALYVAKGSGRSRVVGPDARIEQALGRVLAVEDDPAALRRIRSCLAQTGVDVVTASSLDEGRRLLEAGGVDLLMTDRVLPDGDGLELVRELRKSPAGDGVPVLVLTALTSDNELARSFTAGADDYVQKPWSPVELASRVRRMLERTRARSSGTAGRD